eukprot:m.1347437 g.1347437  ORF g.1347437 m.1347437 type:complete len:599 (-) comp24912_c0_seq6:3797-5593(-)
MASQVACIKSVKGLKPFFIVDGFNFQRKDCRSYFLTHSHSDHTTGLRGSFSNGLIYCSPITAQLIVKNIGVNSCFVRSLPLNKTTVIEEVEVTPIDANHCPGAVCFHFHDRRTGVTVMHVGDFRAAPCVVDNPYLESLLSKNDIDTLYLDTTYAKPKHTFPDQAEVLTEMAKIAKRELQREPKTLFLCGSYSIGKERAIETLCTALDARALVSVNKFSTLTICKRDLTLYTMEDNGPDVRVHVGMLGGGGRHDQLRALLDTYKGRFTAVVAFRPTGWCYTRGRKYDKPWVEGAKGETRIYSVPYSEHSSYTELQAYVKRVRPREIIPTVNAEQQAKRQAQVDRFLDGMDLTQDRRRIDAYFATPTRTTHADSGKSPAQSSSTSTTQPATPSPVFLGGPTASGAWVGSAKKRRTSDAHGQRTLPHIPVCTPQAASFIDTWIAAAATAPPAARRDVLQHETVDVIDLEASSISNGPPAQEGHVLPGTFLHAADGGTGGKDAAPDGAFGDIDGAGEDSGGPEANDAAADSSDDDAAVYTQRDPDERPHTAAPTETVLQGVLGPTCTSRYAIHLLDECAGSVEDACALHFSANGGVVPVHFR